MPKSTENYKNEYSTVLSHACLHVNHQGITVPFLLFCKGYESSSYKVDSFSAYPHCHSNTLSFIPTTSLACSSLFFLILPNCCVHCHDLINAYKCLVSVFPYSDLLKAQTGLSSLCCQIISKLFHVSPVNPFCLVRNALFPRSALPQTPPGFSPQICVH